MKIIKMNIEILNIIHAVLDYKRAICSNNMIFQKENFDYYTETKEYYYSLPLPKELKHNKATFEKILSYANQKDKLNELDNTLYNNLYNYNF